MFVGPNCWENLVLSRKIFLLILTLNCLSIGSANCKMYLDPTGVLNLSDEENANKLNIGSVSVEVKTEIKRRPLDDWDDPSDRKKPSYHPRCPLPPRPNVNEVE